MKVLLCALVVWLACVQLGCASAIADDAVFAEGISPEHSAIVQRFFQQMEDPQDVDVDALLSDIQDRVFGLTPLGVNDSYARDASSVDVGGHRWRSVRVVVPVWRRTGSPRIPVFILFDRRNPVGQFPTDFLQVTGAEVKEVSDLYSSDDRLSGRYFVAYLEPIGSKTLVTVRYAEDKCRSRTWKFYYIKKLPGVVLRTLTPSPSADKRIPVTAVFSEDTRRVYGAYAWAVGGRVTELSRFGVNGRRTVTFTLIPNSDFVMVTAFFVSLVRSPRRFGILFSAITVQHDNVNKITVQLTTEMPNPTNKAPVPIVGTFSEEVSGLTQDKLDVANADVTKFAVTTGANGRGSWLELEVSPTCDKCIVSVMVPRDVATGVVSGAKNEASNNLLVEFDRTPLTVGISSTVPVQSNVNPILISGAFNKPVPSLELQVDDFQVDGGAFIKSVTIVEQPEGQDDNESGTDFTALLDITEPIADVSVALKAGLVRDAAGNTNQESNRLSFQHDRVPPGTALSCEQTAPLSSGWMCTAVFSETVAFVTSDPSAIVFAQGASINLDVPSGAVKSFEFLLTPDPDVSQILVEILASCARDSSGNLNEGSPRVLINHDNVSPEVTLITASPSHTNQLPVTVTATFTEPVLFPQGSADFEAGASHCKLDYTPNTNGAFPPKDEAVTEILFFLVPEDPDYSAMTYFVSEGAGMDRAGNPLMASNVLAITVDRSPPVFTECPAGVETTADAGSVYATVSLETSAHDSVTGFPVTVTNSFNLQGAVIIDGQFEVGTTVVEFTAVDEPGNLATCEVRVTVTDYDPCVTSPCQNGGSCVYSGNPIDFECVCVDGYEGADCELERVTLVPGVVGGVRVELPVCADYLLDASESQVQIGPSGGKLPFARAVTAAFKRLVDRLGKGTVSYVWELVDSSLPVDSPVRVSLRDLLASTTTVTVNLLHGTHTTAGASFDIGLSLKYVDGDREVLSGQAVQTLEVLTFAQATLEITRVQPNQLPVQRQDAVELRAVVLQDEKCFPKNTFTFSWSQTQGPALPHGASGDTLTVDPFVATIDEDYSFNVVGTLDPPQGGVGPVSATYQYSVLPTKPQAAVVDCCAIVFRQRDGEVVLDASISKDLSTNVGGDITDLSFFWTCSVSNTGGDPQDCSLGVDGGPNFDFRDIDPNFAVLRMSNDLANPRFINGAQYRFRVFVFPKSRSLSDSEYVSSKVVDVLVI